MNISNKLMIGGIIGLAAFNPLSTNLIADVLVTAINEATKALVLGSGYIMVASGTLIAVGALLTFEARKKANNKKLKTLKNKPTQKAGKFIEA